MIGSRSVESRVILKPITLVWCIEKFITWVADIEFDEILASIQA